ncbi:adenylylsulfate kinase/chloramphenicol 3-O phosphotransferase [Tumebacillus sp. BK434]|uniref:chloramphenicol phosphotransferase CPT family protein n=1 Tax=Tumebacillus sp. BK434 TaxID=2512169 RepID=UPI0010E6E464|nr:AAA family ATPase [Tumebacillus sp. BK434]TCP59363.1 adenylylsulfate kinase/chloramphenicol 3-O phosphotransferase [Tumebacillus sp. BK434]
MKKGKVIFLNGTSSSGKTSLTKKIQELSAEPYFHLSLDVYENMGPERHLERDYWGILNMAASAMHHSIATFSDRGLNVVVDTVLLEIPQEATWLPECAEVLHDYPVLFVGVHCPLPELERRELERGDREIGQAKWQWDKVHTHGLYDLEINTHETPSDACAAQIFAALEGLEPGQGAFAELHRRFTKEQ